MDVTKNEHLPVKKYVLFLVKGHYPTGGMEDLEGSYDTFEEIDAIIEQPIVRRNWDWYQLVERDTWAILLTGTL